MTARVLLLSTWPVTVRDPVLFYHIFSIYLITTIYPPHDSNYSYGVSSLTSPQAYHTLKLPNSWTRTDFNKTWKWIPLIVHVLRICIFRELIFETIGVWNIFLENWRW
jgi:hypothetical protein